MGDCKGLKTRQLLKQKIEVKTSRAVILPKEGCGANGGLRQPSMEKQLVNIILAALGPALLHFLWAEDWGASVMSPVVCTSERDELVAYTS